jgi:antitoxin component of MazEF toxin-antitoxin module
MNGVMNLGMAKRLQIIGNSAGIIIDKPILELLRITPETELELRTDGERLIITPLREKASRADRIAKVQSKVVRKHEGTFRKLAK